MESHGFAVDNLLDTVKQNGRLGADRGHALREAILACRKGGRVSVPGVYGGFLDKFPLGALMEKGLQLRTGQTHVQRYMPDLLRRIERGRDRHHLPDQPPPAARGGAGGLPELPRQPERVDQGRAEARTFGEARCRHGRSPSSPARRPASACELARCCAEDGYDAPDLLPTSPRSRRRPRELRAGGRDGRGASRPTSPPRRASTRCSPPSATARSTRSSPTPASASATPSSTRTRTRAERVVDTQRHRHHRPRPRGRPAACATRGRGPDPHHRLDRRLHARQLPGGLQRHQGLPRQLQLALRNELKDTG